MTAAPPHIQQLVIDLVRSPEAVDQCTLTALDAEQWDTLVALARQHRCGPYLHHALASLPDFEPPAALRVIRERSAYRTLTIGRECAQIHAILAEAGIEHRFLKGVALAFRDYPHSWMRPMRDIDVLVDPARLVDAHALLVAAGGLIPAYADAPTAPLADGKHLPPIHSPNRALAVEVHYRLILPTVALAPRELAVIEREVWNAPDFVTVGASELPVPPPEVLLAHLVVHGILDHELNNGPLFLTDMIHLSRSGRIDRDKWHALVERMDLQAAVALAAGMLPPAEGAALLGDIAPRERLSDEGLRALMLQAPGRRNDSKLLASMTPGAPRSALRLALRKAFPGSRVLEARWRVEGTPGKRRPRSSAALWLWYVVTRLRRVGRRSTGAEQATLRGLRELRRKLEHAGQR